MTANTQPTQAELLAIIKRQQDELAALKAKGQRKISFKVAQAGGVSVYGLGKWPTTLYASQWEALFTVIPDLQAFIASNPVGLKRKEQEAA